MENTSKPDSAACSPSCGCRTNMSRRTFVKAAGIGTLAVLTSRIQAMAGPFENADFEKWVPADKKLTDQWIKSLFERGLPSVYRGEQLKYIGMPIGGIGAGQLYLGGDGTLWHWDIFNQPISTGSDHYAHPMEPVAPLQQGFTLTVNDQVRTLDRAGFPEVSFRGEYPLGIVEYRDPASPLETLLEAFSPFIPLNIDDSSLPATVLRFTLKNTSAQPVDVTLTGHLENGVCLYSPRPDAQRHNRIRQAKDHTLLDCTAEKITPSAETTRPDVVFEDWTHDAYEGWEIKGEAFGVGPVFKSSIPQYQGDVGGDTEKVVNSHATAPGTTVEEKDGAVGKLISRPFTITHRFIQLWLGGGNSPQSAAVNLLVDGKVVRSVTGQNNNAMSLQRINVCEFMGQNAVLEIVDDARAGWGNIGVGKITFTDQFDASGDVQSSPDFGSMSLALLGPPPNVASDDDDAPACEKLIGRLGRTARLEAGQSTTITFVLTWYFPNLVMDKLPGGRFYATRFPSAAAVAKYVAENIERLANDTRLWHDTWYDASLPYWFLDRTFLNTSILASSTCYRFKDGRFYGWEGVGCCAGTCGHVWQYAHAPARLFPVLERDTRERVDFGLALMPDGAIHFRGEHNDIPAIDAQAGAILRAYREHQMSADDAFLRRNWPAIERALDWLIAKDANADGLIETNQHNTLDTDWYGPVAWLSGLYGAALRAAEAMALELRDEPCARRCREIFDKNRQNLVDKLFNGEYFINKPDPNHLDAINSGTGCEIDQVMGQSWAWQVGLGRVLPQNETIAALRALWRYNFTPDVGPFREANKPGRWYAMPGEAGLLMCTFPRTDWDYAKARGSGAEWAAGYFNECMNGFEYQAAAHMIWEGLVQEGLAVTRAVHDRYAAERRNPWNEIECGDHYARSMASYGVYLAACGFEYHGPKKHLGFAPRLSPENFKAAFTSAEGWGTYWQKINADAFEAEIALKWGKLQIQTLAFAWAIPPKSISLSIAGRTTPCKHETKDGQLLITVDTPKDLIAGKTIQIMAS